MTENNQHWTNQVKHFCAASYPELVKKLNEFYTDRFVIATQIFPSLEDGKVLIDAIVYFKVPPERS